MRYVDLPERMLGGAPMSVLGFGCAGLLGRASRSESEMAVGAALDAGVTFFDTARSYGYGASEGLVGRLLAGKREKVFVCTKFGILPAPRNIKTRLLPVARAVVKAFPGLRNAARSQAGAQFETGQFSVEVLTKSFETSLRELRTDYVDMLLMHAAPAGVLAQDELLEAMGRLVEAGKVRMAGISADLPVIEEYFGARPKVLQTAQFALNLSRMKFAQQTERHGDLLLVANHPFGGPGGLASTRTALEKLANAAELPESLRAKLKAGAGDGQMLPELVLNLIVRGTGVSAVIPAMIQVRHIESNVRAVTECRFTDDELRAMRKVLSARD